MHGILDTSIGWVANGVTGSQAFAAYDAGFDVWLGNSRANPPISHIGMLHNALHQHTQQWGEWRFMPCSRLPSCC